ncbi:MAG: Sec-independent protein translocase protein TatB [Desulfobacterales bacterium]
MFGIGMPEMILILAIALIVLGPKKLPDLAKSLGRAMREFKKATSDFKESIEVDTDFKDVKKTFDDVDTELRESIDVTSSLDSESASSDESKIDESEWDEGEPDDSESGSSDEGEPEEPKPESESNEGGPDESESASSDEGRIDDSESASSTDDEIDEPELDREESKKT